MMNDDDFEQRLGQAFSESRRIVVPPLTRTMRETLHAMRTQSHQPQRMIFLLWRKITTHAEESLTLAKAIGVAVAPVSAPVFRGEGCAESHIGMITVPVAGGEVHIQALPGKNRKTRLVMTAKGNWAAQSDLSVEVALGDRLLEARPLEQKVELSVDGAGAYTVSLSAGESVLGHVILDIGVVEENCDA